MYSATCQSAIRHIVICIEKVHVETYTISYEKDNHIFHAFFSLYIIVRN